MSTETEEVDLNYELGKSIGEYIIFRYLPTLSTDMIKSRNVITVPIHLEREWHEREEKYDKLGYNEDENSESNKVFYANLAWYKEKIERECLPEMLICVVPQINYTDEAKFREGIRDSLWGCDISHYDTKGMIIQSGLWAMKITLFYSK